MQNRARIKEQDHHCVRAATTTTFAATHTHHTQATPLYLKETTQAAPTTLFFSTTTTRWKDGSHWFRCSCLRHARRRQRARSHRPELRDECHRGEVSRAIDWGVIRALSVSGKRSAVLVADRHIKAAGFGCSCGVLSPFSRISRSHGNHHSNLPLPPCTHHPTPPVL